MPRSIEIHFSTFICSQFSVGRFAAPRVSDLEAQAAIARLPNVFFCAWLMPFVPSGSSRTKTPADNYCRTQTNAAVRLSSLLRCQADRSICARETFIKMILSVIKTRSRNKLFRNWNENGHRSEIDSVAGVSGPPNQSERLAPPLR